MWSLWHWITKHCASATQLLRCFCRLFHNYVTRQNYLNGGTILPNISPQFFVLELIYVYNHADKSGDRKVTDSCGLQK